MPKHNLFIKKLKSSFVSINDSLERYFHNLKYLKSKIKKTKLSQNNKAFLIFGSLIFLTLIYFLLPTFYNKDIIQVDIKNQIYKKYNIDIKYNEEIKYGMLPKPHFVAENLFILHNEKKIGVAKNFKIFISADKFFSFNNVEVKDLIFNKTDFSIYKDDLVFFEKLLKTEPSENKIIIKNSNIFFKNDNDDTLFINKIKKSEFYYDSNKLLNIFSSNNEVFNLPYKLTIKNDKFNKVVTSEFSSKKIRLNIDNVITYDDIVKKGDLDIIFMNKSTSFEYQLKKKLLNFSAENQKNTYDGLIEFKPFYFKANFNYEGLSTKNLFNDDSILFDLIQSEILSNKNLNLNINLNVKDIVNISELNNLFLKLAIERGNINLSDTNIMWKDDLKILLSDSLLNYDEEEVYLIGRVIIKINDIDDFYKSFQVNKNYRKEIEEIQFDFNYNFTHKKINFDNFKIDGKSSSNVKRFLDDFNLNAKSFNKITFKNFINNFFKAYFG